MEYIGMTKDERRVYQCVNQVERVRFACLFGPAKLDEEGKFLYVLI
jgi:hypothetical protein